MRRLYRGAQRHPGNAWFVILPLIGAVAGQPRGQAFEAVVFMYAFFAPLYFMSAWHYGAPDQEPPT